MLNMETLPHDLLLKTLSYLRASTLIRLTMTCRWLQEAAVQVARDKVIGATRYAELDGEDYRPWEWTAEQALPMLFRSELDTMLGSLQVEELWTDPGFLVFRLTEEDVDRAVVREGHAMLVYYGDRVDWLHYEAEYDQYDGEDALALFGLRPFETKWQVTSGCDYLVYTQHLSLHPKYGRPTMDARQLVSVTKSECHTAEPLRAWFREAHEDERDAFEAEAQCADATVLLSRFTWGPYMQRLYYKRCQESRVREHEVEPLLSRMQVPVWQRRASPFDGETQRHFYCATFERAEEAMDPFGGRPSEVLVHRAVGTQRCWFRCSLSFFDAVAKKEKRCSLEVRLEGSNISQAHATVG